MKGSTTKAKITYVDEHGETHELDDDFCLAIANNIITAAKGMKMAPEAKLDDGLIDLLLVRTASSFDLMQIFRKLYDGTHTGIFSLFFFLFFPFFSCSFFSFFLFFFLFFSVGFFFSFFFFSSLIDCFLALELPFVDYVKVRSFSITPYVVVKKEGDAEEVQIEEIIDVDGELKGVTPFSVEVIPRCLRVIL